MQSLAGGREILRKVAGIPVHVRDLCLRRFDRTVPESPSANDGISATNVRQRFIAVRASVVDGIVSWERSGGLPKPLIACRIGIGHARILCCKSIFQNGLHIGMCRYAACLPNA
jgi:hypothetical protein